LFIKIFIAARAIVIVAVVMLDSVMNSRTITMDATATAGIMVQTIEMVVEIAQKTCEGRYLQLVYDLNYDHLGYYGDDEVNNLPYYN